MNLDDQFGAGRREGRREAADLVLQSLGHLPAGTPMATKDLILDLYNEIRGTSDGNPEEDTEG